jgi:hypothetical protein
MRWFEPQIHREGTEQSQSRPPSQEPRRHEDTKDSQRPPTHPSKKHRGAETWSRRARSTSVGEKADSDGCLHPESSDFSPATGDYRSSVVLPPISGITFQAQHPPLCVGGWVGGLRVFVSSCLRRGWVDGSSIEHPASSIGRVCGLCVSVPLWFISRQIRRIG